MNTERTLIPILEAAQRVAEGIAKIEDLKKIEGPASFRRLEWDDDSELRASFEYRGEREYDVRIPLSLVDDERMGRNWQAALIAEKEAADAEAARVAAVKAATSKAREEAELEGRERRDLARLLKKYGGDWP